MSSSGEINAQRKGAIRRRICITLAVLGALGVIYFGWSWHRISGEVLVNDPDWPRAFPYPDPWLKALHDWYDARYPVPPGFLKLHGELRRVRLTVSAAVLLSGVVLAVGVAPLALSKRRCRPGLCRNCGYDLRGNPEAASCPECGEAVESKNAHPAATPR